MSLFSRLSGKEIEPEPKEEGSFIEDYAERIGYDIAKAFNEWIRPELAKVIGWDAVNKIQNQDFESVLQTQYKMLSIVRSHTIRKNGATFYFKFRQGLPGKEIILAKFKYEFDFDDYKKEDNE